MSTEETIQSSPTPIKMKNKSITFKDIQKQAKKMDQMSTYILDTDYETNTNTVIKYYEQFSQSRIDSLLQEAYANIEYASANNIDFFEGENQDSIFMHYISFLISIRFTNLDKIVPTTLPEQIPFMTDMYETGLLNRIHEEVLPQDQIFAILEKLESFSTLVNQISNLEETTRNEILSSVQNKEILGNNPHANVIHPLVNPPVSPTPTSTVDTDDIDA